MSYFTLPISLELCVVFFRDYKFSSLKSITSNDYSDDRFLSLTFNVIMYMRLKPKVVGLVRIISL